MDAFLEKLRLFWEWIPKWQFYGAIVLAAVLWVVRQFSVAQVVLVVAAIAWFVGFIISQTDMAEGIGGNALNFAMLGAGALGVILFWYFLIRKG